jgi:hypothetical protein
VPGRGPTDIGSTAIGRIELTLPEHKVVVTDLGDLLKSKMT